MNPFRRRIQTAAMSGGVAAFSPASIAGLKVWLDMTDAASVTIGTGVSQINDKSGNSNHATQSTASKQPDYTSGQYVTFDGVDDWLEIPAIGAIGTGPRSYVARVYFTAIQDGGIVTLYRAGAGFPGFALGVRDSAGIGVGKRLWGFDKDDLSSPRRVVTTSDQDAVEVSVALVRTETTDKIYINGAFNASLSGASHNITSNYKTFLGCFANGNTGPYAIFYAGRLSKVLIYDDELSSGDVQYLYANGY